MVIKKNADNFARPTITFDQLAKSPQVPEIPQNFRDQLWRTIKVSREIKITEESEHFLNLMGLHFGLPRSEMVCHAINLLWKEVVQSISTEQLLFYEEKLEVLRLHRLQQREEKQIRRAERFKAGAEEWEKRNNSDRARLYGNYQTWSYRYDTKPKD